MNWTKEITLEENLSACKNFRYTSKKLGKTTGIPPCTQKKLKNNCLKKQKKNLKENQIPDYHIRFLTVEGQGFNSSNI